MFPKNDEPVSEAGEGVVEQPTTPENPDNGVSGTPETPTSNLPSVDVEKLKADYEAQLATYQRDINQMKSSLQKQTAQVENQWRSRYDELQREMHQIRMKGMTEEERANYERQLESEEMRSLQEKIVELQQERTQQASAVNAFNFFVQNGVPADRLNLTEGAEAIAQAGWAYINSELNRLREQAANPQPTSQQPAPLKRAPEVVNDKSTPGGGTTWTALIKAYGSRENVYRAVEEGRAPASIIPLEG